MFVGSTIRGAAGLPDQVEVERIELTTSTRGERQQEQEQDMLDAAITILNSHLLPPGPLPVWAYAVELCSTSRGAEIWEHTTNQHLAAYRQALR